MHAHQVQRNMHCSNSAHAIILVVSFTFLPTPKTQAGNHIKIHAKRHTCRQAQTRKITHGHHMYCTYMYQPPPLHTHTHHTYPHTTLLTELLLQHLKTLQTPKHKLKCTQQKYIASLKPIQKLHNYSTLLALFY